MIVFCLFRKKKKKGYLKSCRKPRCPTRTQMQHVFGAERVKCKHYQICDLWVKCFLFGCELEHEFVNF